MQTMRNWDKWTGHLSHYRMAPVANETNDLSTCPTYSVTSARCVIDVEKCQHVIVQAVGIEKAIRITHGSQ